MPDQSKIPLPVQTLYAELVDRAASAAFDEAFADDGTFVSKAMRGRRYWYFQTAAGGERRQLYVGIETAELLERIGQHKQKQGSQRDRQTLVSTLVRSANLPRPTPEVGEIIKGLAAVGVFRLRGVLVGTVAYQTYSAMLGTRLPLALIQTGDIDVAQFANVSIAVEDFTPPMLEILLKVDPSFRPVPHLHGSHRATTYEASGGLRVDFLTPNEGPESDAPEALPALGTDAQPLQFLDFLIHEPVPAVLLHGSGVYVQVPAPDRFAVHKLIVARRRHAGSGKRDKDILQAEGLFDLLQRKRPFELKAAWDEAYGRGDTWARLLGEGLGSINADVRDLTLKAIGACRSVIPGLALTFSAPAARYDRTRHIVTFVGTAADKPIRCAISGEALDDHFHAGVSGHEDRLKSFRSHRGEIEYCAQQKYRHWPVEDAGEVLIKTEDVVRLREVRGRNSAPGDR